MSLPSIVAAQAEAAELAADRHQVGGLGVADPQLAAGRGGERHEARDLDVVGADRVLGAAELVAAVHRHHVRADAVDRARPSSPAAAARSWTCGSQAALLIVVGPGRQRSGHQRVLRAHHRGLVHEDRAGLEAAGGADLDHALARDLRPRGRGRRRGADRGAGGRCSRRPAAASCASPKRARSGPASRKEARIRAARGPRPAVVGDRRPRGGGARCPRAARPSRRGSRAASTCASVSRIRGTLREDDVLVREQAGGEDRQRRVLVAGGLDLPGKRERRLE